MSNNSYLHDRLSRTSRKLEPGWEPLVCVSYKSKRYKIYVPGTCEYLITVDVVKKALAIGANTISYAKAWCQASEEAKIYGRANGIAVISHGELFRELKIDKDNSG